jgi:hypothetical protein
VGQPHRSPKPLSPPRSVPQGDAVPRPEEAPDPSTAAPTSRASAMFTQRDNAQGEHPKRALPFPKVPPLPPKALRSSIRKAVCRHGETRIWGGGVWEGVCNRLSNKKSQRDIFRLSPGKPLCTRALPFVHKPASTRWECCAWAGEPRVRRGRGFGDFGPFRSVWDKLWNVAKRWQPPHKGRAQQRARASQGFPPACPGCRRLMRRRAGTPPL